MLICIAILCTPVLVKAEPEPELVEQPLKIDSFVINSIEGEKYNATLTASAAMEITFEYTVSVITDISQKGAQVAYGIGKTGQDTIVDIDMSSINTFDNYRFKITATYYVDDQKYITNEYSQIFEYTQETYADDLSGRNLTVDMLAKILKINWERYYNYSAESVLVIIEVDGEKVVEDVIPINEGGYDYYFDQNTKQIKIELKQVINGKLSKGITETIDIVKSSDTKDFYLTMPESVKQYDPIWNIAYYNGESTQLQWNTDSDRGEYEFTGDGSFLVEMNDDNEELFISYTDAKNVVWEYNFLTNIVDFAPTVHLLEEYNGAVVEGTSIDIVGKVDDTSATVKVNGKKVTVDDKGTFTASVELQVGKNAIDIEATSIIGKTSRKSITVYKSGSDAGEKDTGLFGKYSALIISLSTAIVLVVIIFIVARKEGKRNEKENKS